MNPDQLARLRKAAEKQIGAVAAPIRASAPEVRRSLAIIGSAGRNEDGARFASDADRPPAKYVAEMLRAAREAVDKTGATELVSGGAAWADHIAVMLFLEEPERFTLRLELPAELTEEKNGERRYVDTGVRNFKTNPGGTANYYHELFQSAFSKARAGWSPFKDIATAARHANCTIRVTPGLHARNEKVAMADHCLAMTFGDGAQLKDGGTAHTMGLFTGRNDHGWGYHFDLNTLTLHTNAWPEAETAKPAPAQPQEERAPAAPSVGQYVQVGRGIEEDEEFDVAGALAAAAEGGVREFGERPVGSAPEPEAGTQRLNILPADEQRDLSGLLRWSESMLLGTLTRDITAIPRGRIWHELEKNAQLADAYPEFLKKEPPAWVGVVLREAINGLSDLPPKNERTEIILAKANPTQLMHTLVRAAPGRTAALVDEAAARKGFRLSLRSGNGVEVSEQLMQTFAHWEKVQEWCREAGVSPDASVANVVSALGIYPGTKAWMGAHDDEVSLVLASRADRGAKSLENQQMMTMFHVMQTPEVFNAIPQALQFANTVLVGDPAKSPDFFFPTRVLMMLRSISPDRSANPNDDLKPYLEATPPNVGYQPQAGAPDRDRFYRNYAFFALGGLDDQYIPKNARHLFRDLISRDLIEEVGPSGKISPEIDDRMNRVLRQVRAGLQMMPEAVEHDFRFLVGARSSDAKLRMLGMYLAALPYRQMLLGPGPLSLWRNRGLLSDTFARALAKAYEARVVEPPSTPVAVFTAENRQHVRELAGLRMLASDASTRGLISVVAWLQEEGQAYVRYQEECQREDKKAKLPAGATEQRNREFLERYRDMPQAVEKGSPAALVLGLVLPSRESTAAQAVGEFGSPADVAAMVFTAAQAIALESGTQNTAFLQHEGAIDQLAEAQTRLTRLGEVWTGGREDWRELGSVLQLPVAQRPMDEFLREQLSQQLATVMQLPKPELGIPQVTYTALDKASLDRVLEHPSAPSLLRTVASNELAEVLHAAAVLQSQPLELDGHTQAWRAVVDGFRERVTLQKGIDVSAPPARNADGSFQRPRRSIRVESSDFDNPEVLREKAGKVLGVPGESLVALPVMRVEARDWESPRTWRQTENRMAVSLAPVRIALGQELPASELPRILRFAAACAERPDVLQHASNVAGALFTPAAGNAPLRDLLAKTDDLVRQAMNGTELRLGKSQAPAGPARLTLAQPIAVAAALPGSERPVALQEGSPVATSDRGAVTQGPDMAP